MTGAGAHGKVEILELLYRYAELIDSGDFDAVGELLSRAQFGGPRTPMASGAQNIAAIFAMTTKRFADTGTPKTRHLVLNPIVEIDGDTATARSTFLVVQATESVPFQPIVAGRYYDKFARDAGGDKFARDAGGDKFARDAGGDKFARDAGGDKFARDAGGDKFARDAGGPWYFTERIADVEMTGDVSDHLQLDPARFEDLEKP